MIERSNVSQGPVAVLRLSDLGKRFGAVTALDNVSFEVMDGETVGLVGDNGAGKSTLMKIISGVHQHDTGRMEVWGQEQSFASPASAREAGIEAVYQDLALVDDMSVAENMFLGREPMKPGVLGQLGVIDHRAMRDQATQSISRLGVNIPGLGNTLVRKMSGGQRQAAAIARAIYWGRRLILLDEPTAALGVKEQNQVEKLVQELRQKKLPMLLIAHNMPLIFRLTDRVIVLRRGRLVANLRTKETTPDEVVGFITGAEAVDAIAT